MLLILASGTALMMLSKIFLDFLPVEINCSLNFGSDNTCGAVEKKGKGPRALKRCHAEV